ncbi:hypothetical protein K7I13_06195 [Brucepastera parasyntrophica]|uniref:hypothetical protein n=1 Tax=Brucepastera parasyntrophica TaxID=2880008 RepID=UPI00210B7F14|nr:hypothetical protein [Brucepastera parasyntrophica]ULQ60853.1 hypothetical protein K7I13_06195 [Brucepastera parasyntrophica]
MRNLFSVICRDPPALAGHLTNLSGLILCFILCVLTASCMVHQEALTILGGDITIPKLENFEVTGGRELRAVFSRPVKILSARAVTANENPENLNITFPDEQEASEVSFFLEYDMETGAKAVLSALVADKKGNTLSFSVPFSGYNNCPAELLINELRAVYSKPKVEYIEFLVLGSGNLSGIEVFNAMNPDNPYIFPAAEVTAGEFIILHLRSIEDGILDEITTEIISGGTEASPHARDFWAVHIPNKVPLKPTSVIIVRERENGRIMDAVLCIQEGSEVWPNDTVKKYAELAAETGAWHPSALTEDAVVMPNSSATTRSLGRNEYSDDSNGAPDWKFCATGKYSPGKVNEPH